MNAILEKWFPLQDDLEKVLCTYVRFQKPYVKRWTCSSQFLVVKTGRLHPCYSFRRYARAALAWTEKKSSLRNEKLKAN